MYKGDDRSNERKRKARNTSTSSISLCSEFDSSEIKDSVEKVVKREHCRNMFKQNNHLNSCDYHTFCLDCLETWSKNKSICPVDRKEFKSILVLDVKGKIIKQIAIKAPQSDNSSNPSDTSMCMNCGLVNNTDSLSICAGCQITNHILQQLPLVSNW
ncbi:hypothetical protein ABEB36_002874 [Hypothenemus hampei]|uniref:RING-type domain-containing protein n=1 Tax=Hypothenemus hampei TaxID=57062 RepID=A0ABD1F7A3_HYPHA